VTPSWPSLAIGFLGPLFIASFAKFIDLSERPKVAAVHFLTGALLAFVALITERYVFAVFGPSIPARYHVVVEAFLFIALAEEVVKIAQISELSRRNAGTVRETIASGIAVAAGFAGAENVIYLFRYSGQVDGLLLIRTLTANPMHLAVAVIASSYVFEGLRDEAKSHYLAVAVLIATAFHGLYDYLIMSSGGRTASYIFVLVFAVSWAWQLTPLPNKSG
jgi:RsiW-degrading membrane proteinase PrsW (M82 family)